MIKKHFARILIVAVILAASFTLTGAAEGPQAPNGVPYNRALRDTAAIQIYAAYVSWGGPQYATAANMDQAIKAANIFVEKLSTTGLR